MEAARGSAGGNVAKLAAGGACVHRAWCAGLPALLERPSRRPLAADVGLVPVAGAAPAGRFALVLQPRAARATAPARSPGARSAAGRSSSSPGGGPAKASKSHPERQRPRRARAAPRHRARPRAADRRRRPPHLLLGHPPRQRLTYRRPPQPPPRRGEPPSPPAGSPTGEGTPGRPSEFGSSVDDRPKGTRDQHRAPAPPVASPPRPGPARAGSRGRRHLPRGDLQPGVGGASRRCWVEPHSRHYPPKASCGDGQAW